MYMTLTLYKTGLSQTFHLLVLECLENLQNYQNV